MIKIISLSIQGLIFLALFTIIAFSDIIVLIKKREKKELWVYTIIGSVSIIALFFFEIGIKIPSPSKIVEIVVLKILGK